MSAIKAAAPKGVKVSVFNMKLLKVADYSGVQKAVAKFDRAKLVVVLGARAAKPLKKTKLRTNVILVNAAASKVTGKTTLHVVTGKSPAPTKSKPIEVAKAPAMDRKNAVDGACFRLTGKFGLPEGMWRLRELLTSK
ncbi:MAG TPA: hypothetical protein ENI87_05860 [bacterium]|nr:hypothetical protein [bacterium]